MSISIQPVVRKFKIGHLLKDDPCPEQPLDIVFRVLCGMFPSLRHTNGLFEEDGTLNDDGTQIIYTVPFVPPKTNG